MYSGKEKKINKLQLHTSSWITLKIYYREEAASCKSLHTVGLPPQHYHTGTHAKVINCRAEGTVITRVRQGLLQGMGGAANRERTKGASKVFLPWTVSR